MRRDNHKDIQQFKDTMKKMDVIRDENILETFPELKELYEEELNPAKATKHSAWHRGRTRTCHHRRRDACVVQSREPAQSFKQYIDTGNDAKGIQTSSTLEEHWNSDHMKICETEVDGR